MAPVLIIGGGLRGCLAALALSARRPELPFLLIEQGRSLGGGPIPPFFLDALSERARALVDPLITGLWDGFYLAAAEASAAMEGRVAQLGPGQLHAEIVQRLRPGQYRLGAYYEGFDGARARLADGGAIDASFVLDARGRSARPGPGGGWCHAVSRVFDFPAPHALDRPVLADATLKPPGWSFLQYFPLGPARLTIRYMRHSTSRRMMALGDGSGLGEAGTLIEQSLSIFPLGGRSVVEPPVDPDLPHARAPGAAGLNPLLPSPVAAAAAFAIDFAALPFARPSALASALFRREARMFGRSGADPLIGALCGGDGEVTLAMLRAFAGKSL